MRWSCLRGNPLWRWLDGFPFGARDRKGIGGFRSSFAQDEEGLNGAEVWEGGKVFHQEDVVFGHVFDRDFYKEVELASEAMALHDLGKFDDVAGKAFQEGAGMFL